MRNSLAALTLALAAVTMVATTGPARAGYGSGAGVISVGEPDHLVYIFDKGIYFVPNIDADIFYHLGRWYQRSAGRWYESPSHGGPWAELPLSGVPKPLIEIPMDFREAYDRYGRVPYRFVVRGKFRYYGVTGRVRMPTLTPIRVIIMSIPASGTVCTRTRAVGIISSGTATIGTSDTSRTGAGDGDLLTGSCPLPGAGGA